MVVLIIVLGFAALIAIDFAVHRQEYMQQIRGGAPQPLELALPPAGYFMDPGHGWAALEPGGTLRVGAGPMLLALLGRPDKVQAPAVGAQVQRGHGAATLGRGQRSLSLPAAVDGRVVEVNAALLADPSTLGDDPYERGWLYRVAPAALGRALADLRVSEEGLSWLRAELTRLREQVSQVGPAPVGATALDGGLPVDGLSEHLDDEAWQELVRTMLGRDA